MKKIILLLILGCAFTAEAQYGYGNGGRQRQDMRRRQMMQTPQKAPKPDFNVENYLGIVVYDIEKAAKKSSIKLSSKEGKQFSKILSEYNQSIKDVTRINSFLLRSAKEMVEGFQKKAIKSGDFSEQPKIQKKMDESLKQITEILNEEDIKLDASIKALLSKKQYKKWIKYNNKKLSKSFKKE